MSVARIGMQIPEMENQVSPLALQSMLGQNGGTSQSTNREMMHLVHDLVRLMQQMEGGAGGSQNGASGAPAGMGGAPIGQSPVTGGVAPGGQSPAASGDPLGHHGGGMQQIQKLLQELLEQLGSTGMGQAGQNVGASGIMPDAAMDPIQGANGAGADGAGFGSNAAGGSPMDDMLQMIGDLMQLMQQLSQGAGQGGDAGGGMPNLAGGGDMGGMQNAAAGGMSQPLGEIAQGLQQLLQQLGGGQQQQSVQGGMQQIIQELEQLLQQLQSGGSSAPAGGPSAPAAASSAPAPSGPSAPAAASAAPAASGPSAAGGGLGPNVPSALQPYVQDIEAASKQTGVPASLIGAQILQESGGNPDAVTTNPALGLPDTGLMQVDQATFQGLQQQNPGLLGGKPVSDPATNIMAGSLYLAQMLKQNNGNVSAALTAYNGGADPNYVSEVTAKMNALQNGTQVPGGF